MKHLALVVAALSLVVGERAFAADWKQFPVSSSASGTAGIAAKASGIVDDRHGTRAAQLVVSCSDGRTSVFISAEYLVFGGDVVRVEYTIDQGAARRGYWNVCAGDLCAGLWNGASIPFVEALLDAATLRMRMTRAFGEPISLAFDVQGARQALTEVRRQCGWPTR
ncbi:MAG: hypothetical protein JOY64_12210 [Alphaproteobacteria bacterium]|nr:hypothetical protein [Alphaproteobacteria bacterium]MBV8408390.1 hypothetical protein [Alphaproteobacteria bacterium]